MPQYRLGENAKLYYSTTLATSTSYSIPSTTADNVKDVKVGAKHDTPEYTTRNNNGRKQYAVSLTDEGISFQIKVPAVGVTDASYVAFRNAYKNKSEIAAYALTGDKTEAGVEGPAGNWVVGSFEIDQGNGSVQFATVELKLSSFNDWYVAP